MSDQTRDKQHRCIGYKNNSEIPREKNFHFYLQLFNDSIASVTMLFLLHFIIPHLTLKVKVIISCLYALLAARKRVSLVHSILFFYTS